MHRLDFPALRAIAAVVVHVRLLFGVCPVCGVIRKDCGHRSNLRGSKQYRYPPLPYFFDSGYVRSNIALRLRLCERPRDWPKARRRHLIRYTSISGAQNHVTGPSFAVQIHPQHSFDCPKRALTATRVVLSTSVSQANRYAVQKCAVAGFHSMRHNSTRDPRPSLTRKRPIRWRFVARPISPADSQLRVASTARRPLSEHRISARFCFRCADRRLYVFHLFRRR
jgi:hypothetical protein